MLEAGKDFDVEDEYGIIRCVAKTDEARSAFKVLQLRLVKLLPQLPNPPAVTLNVNGIIGPSATLVCQAIALRLLEGHHRELADYALAQPEVAIPMTASHAMELAGYLDEVMAKDPHAIVAPLAPPEPKLDPMQMVKDYFTKKRIIATSAMLCGLGGLAAVAVASQHRALGMIDRSAMLPPSDGSDNFDDDDDETEYDDQDDQEGQDLQQDHAA